MKSVRIFYNDLTPEDVIRVLEANRQALAYNDGTMTVYTGVDAGEENSND